jgi:hypothetical protein
MRVSIRRFGKCQSGKTALVLESLLAVGTGNGLALRLRHKSFSFATG